VVAVITLGRPLGFLDDKDAFSQIKATTAFSWYIGIASHIPWIHRIFQDNPIMRRASPPPIAKFAEKIVHERLSKPTSSREQSDSLFHFIETHKRQPLMTEEQITISVVGNLLAGTLSPSSAMKELTRYLATHPLSQQKLCEELQHAGVTSPASFASVKDLPYLEGIVREAFRLHAQIIVRQERVAPAGGLTLPDGTYLPAGTKIGALGQAMTLNREVFGDDADEYVPERWMKREEETDEAYTERRNRMERTDMTFGQGSRSCIGKNLTILEFFKAVASLSLCFTFSAVGSMDAFDTYVRVQRRPVGVGKPLIAS
jgi:cytochrome P450